MARAVANRLFERKVLLASEQFQRAHGRVGVRLAEDGIHRDPDAAAKCERIGGIPLRSDHGVNHVGFRTEQGDVDRVAGNAVGRVRDAGFTKRDCAPSSTSGRAPTLLTPAMHVYEVRPRKDKRGADLISDALPFGRLWYGEPNAISNAIGYAEHYSR